MEERNMRPNRTGIYYPTAGLISIFSAFLVGISSTVAQKSAFLRAPLRLRAFAVKMIGTISFIFARDLTTTTNATSENFTILTS